MIDSKKLCSRCLADFTNKSEGVLRSHARRCNLPYSRQIYNDEQLVIYCINATDSHRERKHVFKSVACTMQHSDEIAADSIGWYIDYGEPYISNLKPHAFIPVLAGNSIGIVVVTWGVAGLYRPDRNGGAPELSQRWCIGRIWFAPAFRRRKVATSVVPEIAAYLGITVSDLAWVSPNRNCLGLINSLCGDTFYVAAG